MATKSGPSDAPNWRDASPEATLKFVLCDGFDAVEEGLRETLAAENDIELHGTVLSSNSGIGIAKHTGLNVMTNVRFSKVQNMAHSRNLAAAMRSARVRFDYQSRAGGQRIVVTARSQLD